MTGCRLYERDAETKALHDTYRRLVLANLLSEDDDDSSYTYMTREEVPKDLVLVSRSSGTDKVIERLCSPQCLYILFCAK